MKLTIPTKTLSAPLAALKTIAKPNKTHAILGNVALIADKKTLRLIGQDLEKRMEIVLSCKPKETGSITLSCAFLADLCAQRKDPECTISTDGNTATITLGRHVGKKPGLPIEDMPQWPEIAGKCHKLTIPAPVFNEALTKCLVQSSTDESRAILNSVFIVSRRGKLNFQATNGQRMIIVYTDIEADFGGTQFIIPAASVSTMASLVKEGDVELELGDNLLTIGTDDTRFSTLLIEGSMPQDFENVYPPKERLATRFSCNRESLIDEIKTSQNYISEMMAHVKIKCDGKQVSVVADGQMKQSDLGLGSSSIDAKKGSGEIEFAVNPQYLVDMLNAFPEDEVEFEFEDEKIPFVMRNETITTSVVPMRIG